MAVHESVIAVGVRSVTVAQVISISPSSVEETANVKVVVPVASRTVPVSAMFVVIESGHPKACFLPDVYHTDKGGSDFHGFNNRTSSFGLS